ncbi:hypothetical protein [Halioxenophilus sp. WMMB6]|uniref:hypothetical protein n=1 Tax=Halioxenophilus sp. WMMB6 TaxID=3073815 RepID=UPI00295EC139|nr:hypothetical protein [Halioxenophilus sp. WMMB6]
MKKMWWLWAPVILVIAGLLVLWLTPGEQYPLPRVLEQNEQGVLLALPVISDSRKVSWQGEWVAASAPAEQTVQALLNQFAEGHASAPPHLQIIAHEGLASREQIAQRLGAALASHQLGGVTIEPFSDEANKSGVVLHCAIADTALARELLGALTPYLGGRVALLFDQSLAAGSMELLLFGTPYFNGQGQATFDPDIIPAAK